MKGAEKRSELARIAYDSYEDKSKSEKYLKVCRETFEMCLTDMPKHHQTINRKRGFLRTYYKPFWTENPKGSGWTYHLGVIYIINEDAPVNQIYELRQRSDNFESKLTEAIRIKRHRLMSMCIDVSTEEVVAILTPQRWNFDD